MTACEFSNGNEFSNSSWKLDITWTILAKTCKYKANEWREEILTSEDFKQAYSVHPTTRYL